jgi:REP element-mobilizing transposase RayT
LCVILPDYVTYNHSVGNINYHLVWCVKYRKAVLIHDKDIVLIFKDIFQQYSWTINTIEVMPDHFHSPIPLRMKSGVSLGVINVEKLSLDLHSFRVILNTTGFL